MKRRQGDDHGENHPKTVENVVFCNRRGLHPQTAGRRGSWGTRAGARLVAKRALAEVDHAAASPGDRERLLEIVDQAARYGTLKRDRLRDVANTIAKRAQRDPLDAQYRFDPDLLAD